MTAPWWAEAFGDDYLDVYPHRDLASARVEARFLAANGLRGRVLDLCCGWGRHLAALLEDGLDAYGLDWSEELLARVADETGSASAQGRLVRGDARHLPFQDGSFDGVVSLFSSFGYFGPEGDTELLHGIARVLAPGGRAFLDLMNPAHVRAALVPESRTEREGAVLHERRAIDGPVVSKRVELRRPDGTLRVWREEVWMYEPEELVRRAAEAALVVEHAWGGFDGSAFGPRSPRQVLRLRRERR